MEAGQERKGQAEQNVRQRNTNKHVNVNNNDVLPQCSKCCGQNGSRARTQRTSSTERETRKYWTTTIMLIITKFCHSARIVSRNNLQFYSGDTVGTKASVSWIEVSREWRLGWGLLIINQQIKYFSFTDFCLRICCSHCFKQVNNV